MMASEGQVKTGLGIIKAKLAVMNEVRGVRKDRINKHQGYEFTGHDDVTEALQEAFVKYGIDQQVSISECVRELDGQLLRVKVRVIWTALEDGTYQDVFTWGETTVKNSKGRPDGVEVGQALSYAVKVAQLKNFMLVGGLIPDAEDSHGEREERRAIQEEPRRDTQRAPAPDGGGIEEDEIKRQISMLGKFTTMEELRDWRNKIAATVKLMSREQKQRLGEVDKFTEERISGA